MTVLLEPEIYTFNNADLVNSVTTPNPGSLGGAPETTTTFYDALQVSVLTF